MPVKVSPIEIAKYLKGLKFPASKRDVIKHAKQKDATTDVIQVLEDMPNREYDSPTQVEKAAREPNRE